MNSGSRTSKSVKNAKIALLFYFVNLILQFFSRKIFLDYLGAEVLGLNTTAMNLLQFLNLAELGITSAISFTLYKPIASNDREEINEIISVQGYLYRNIGFLILLGGILLMFFFPYFFAKAQLPLWYAYATFGVLLAGALMGYFFNYPMIILSADQKNYKLTYVVESIRSLKIIIQIILIFLLPHKYIWWLGVELVASIVTVFVINALLKAEYPWLRVSPKFGRIVRKKHALIITKTKQMFFHKIAGFALGQASPLIIYAYTTLTLVAIYGNYMLIVAGIIALQNALFTNVSAGVGNLVAEGDKERILAVFRELFSVRFLLVGTISLATYLLASSFVTLWVGEQYLLDETSLLLIIAILYINTMRGVVDAYIYAYGLFHDIWAPIAEASLNLGLSVVFGYFWGLNGVLGGNLVSLVVIVFLWRPYFLFRDGLKEPFRIYMGIYIKHLLAYLVMLVFVISILRLLNFSLGGSFWDFFKNALIVTTLSGGTLGLILYFVEPKMRDFVKRFLSILKH